MDKRVQRVGNAAWLGGISHTRSVMMKSMMVSMRCLPTDDLSAVDLRNYEFARCYKVY